MQQTETITDKIKNYPEYPQYKLTGICAQGFHVPEAVMGAQTRRSQESALAKKRVKAQEVEIP